MADNYTYTNIHIFQLDVVGWRCRPHAKNINVQFAWGEGERERKLMFVTKTSICSFVFSPNFSISMIFILHRYSTPLLFHSSFLSLILFNLTTLFPLNSFSQHSIHMVASHGCAHTMALWVFFGYFHFIFITLCVEIDFNVRTQSKCLAIEISVVCTFVCIFIKACWYTQSHTDTRVNLSIAKWMRPMAIFIVFEYMYALLTH